MNRLLEVVEGKKERSKEKNRNERLGHWEDRKRREKKKEERRNKLTEEVVGKRRRVKGKDKNSGIGDRRISH